MGNCSQRRQKSQKSLNQKSINDEDEILSIKDLNIKSKQFHDDFIKIESKWRLKYLIDKIINENRKGNKSLEYSINDFMMTQKKDIDKIYEYFNDLFNKKDGYKSEIKCGDGICSSCMKRVNCDFKELNGLNGNTYECKNCKGKNHLMIFKASYLFIEWK